MLDYAAKLTRSPHAVGDTDVQRLRHVGFDDTGILDICQVVAYYNYVNRLADGLGVELEDLWSDEDLTLTREEFHEVMAAKSESATSEAEGCTAEVEGDIAQ